MKLCSSFDFKASGRIRVSAFVNILKFNVPDIEDDILNVTLIRGKFLNKIT